jgi:hypothetical protein
MTNSFLSLELHMNRLGRLDYDDVFGGELKCFVGLCLLDPNDCPY